MSGPKIFLYIGMGAIGGTCFVATAYWTAICYAPAPTYSVSDSERERTWEKIAPTYFNDTQGQEFYLGIRNMRKKLATECRGDVLEVGAGTGVMVGLYPALEEKIDDEVMAGRSAEGKAHRKAETTDIASTILDKALVNAKLDQEKKTSQKGGGSKNDNKINGVRQVIMGDRAGSMLKELEEKINNRLGFLPHRITEPEATKWVAGTLNFDLDKNPTIDSSASSSSSTSSVTTKTGTTFSPSALSNVGGTHTASADATTNTKSEIAAAATSFTPSISGALIKTADGEKHPLYQTCNFSAESIPFPDNSFDTVVDIFGLCSYDDPVKALMEMSRVCKPDGNILLLEHGKGTWSKINGQLDKWAPRHAKTWGCWWNRDHRRYIRLAGLKVVSREEKHFGTTQKMVVKPNKNWMPECKHVECHTGPN